MAFTLSGIVLEGRTALSTSDALGFHRPRIGQPVTVADLHDVAAAVTQAYRKRGYFLSVATVPPQRIENGRATIRVIEGAIGEVELRGVSVGPNSLATRTAQVLLGSAPISSALMERQLLLINDLPGVIARGTLVPSDRGIGFAKLILDVEHEQLRFDFEANNRGGEYLGPARFRGRVVANSLMGMPGAFVLELATAASTRQFRSIGLDQTARIGTSGASLRIGYTDYRSEPDLSSGFGDFHLETDSKTATAEFAYPLMRSRRTNLSVRSGVRFHRGLTESDFIPTPTEDRIVTLRAGLSFDHADAFRGITAGDLEISKGTSWFGASRRGDAGLSRPSGDPAGSKAVVYLARLQSLAAHFSVLLAATGQYAFANVLAPEEFSFGGEYLGRAFDAGELVGDSGASAKIELRCDVRTADGIAFTPYTFYETGWISRRLGLDDVGFASERESARSAGAGVRFTLGRIVTGFVEAAKPVDRSVATDGTRHTRVFAGLRISL